MSDEKLTTFYCHRLVTAIEETPDSYGRCELVRTLKSMKVVPSRRRICYNAIHDL
ncbi:MAG TPA: hypothetical protein VII61_13745 [Ktedonobacteraceae bacterium]